MKRILTIVLLSGSMLSCALFKKTNSAVGEAIGDDNMAMSKSDLSPEQSLQIGREMAAGFLKRYPRVDNEDAQTYLNKVGQYAAMHLDQGKKNIKCVGGREKLLPFKGFRFTLVKAAEPIAVSLPGGFVFVSTGMVKLMRSEDQLAGVLAHEATHIVCQDGLGEIENAALKRGVSKAAGAGADLAQKSGLENPLDDTSQDMGIGDTGTDAVSEGAKALAEKAYEHFFQNPFSRGQEKVADRGALMAMYRAGFWPSDYIVFTEGLREEESARHPASADRIKWLKKDYAKMEKRVTNTQSARASRFATFRAQL